MTRVTSYLRNAVFGGLLAGIAIMLLLIFMQTEVTADIKASLSNQKVLSETLEGWQVTYTVEPENGGNYWVARNNTFSSAEDVTTAVQAMNKTAKKLAQSGVSFKATLVFASPVSPADFKAFAQNNGLAPTASVLQAVGDGGEPQEIGIPPAGEPLNPQILADVQTRKHNPARIIGVVTTDVVLDKTSFDKVSQDARVYAIDVLPYIAVEGVKREYPKVEVDKIQVGRSLLYNAMQQTGIAPPFR